MKACTKFQLFTIFAHTRRIDAAAQKSEASPQQNSGPVLNFLDFFATTPEDNFQMHCSYWEITNHLNFDQISIPFFLELILLKVMVGLIFIWTTYFCWQFEKFSQRRGPAGWWGGRSVRSAQALLCVSGFHKSFVHTSYNACAFGFH